MKIIDKLLVKSFIPPFIVTFFIALFVLIMQFLWKWIDDIIGKGVGFLFILEMLGYMTISLIPMALPIAVLISSVMVMGNLSERYELSSLKSAGVSLARVMFPLMVLTFFISIFSFFCSDQLIPITNLKYQSRLYDIKNQKPTLSLDEGVFNDDFQGFSIRIKEKEADNRSIKKVLMYDQKTSNNQFSQVAADRGEMFVTQDERFFVLNLFDGYQNMETKPTIKDGKSNYPFVRTSFKEWNRVFDLSEFSINRTDENAFKDHYNMLSTRQLIEVIDSIDRRKEQKLADMATNIDRTYYLRLLEEQQRRADAKKGKPEAVKVNIPASVKGSVNVDSITKYQSAQVDKKRNSPKKVKRKAARNTLQQKQDMDLVQYTSFAQTFSPSAHQKLFAKAQTYVNNSNQAVSTTLRWMKREDEKRMKNVYHANNKLSTAVACFIFLFIGAPMGAIIRKGGFGYPLLVAVIFFVSYIMMTILFKKTMEGGGIDPTLSAWMPCFIILPIGIILTRAAMRDSKGLQLNYLKQALGKLFQRFKKTANA